MKKIKIEGICTQGNTMRMDQDTFLEFSTRYNLPIFVHEKTGVEFLVYNGIIVECVKDEE